ncbi:MAG: phosphoribosylglycinamide formyltransferase [Gemmatimonadales bacterium]
MTYRVAVAVSGRGSNLLALVDALATDPVAEVVLVLSDRAASAIPLAESRGIPTHQLRDHRDGGEWRDQLDSYGIDLLVLAGYLKLVPPEVVKAMSGRIINIHPALLPGYGGPGMYGHRVHQAVLAAGERTSGASVHLVDEVYDRGEILAQSAVPVISGDTPATLAARVLETEHKLLPLVVKAAAKAGRPVATMVDKLD